MFLIYEIPGFAPIVAFADVVVLGLCGHGDQSLVRHHHPFPDVAIT